MPPEVYLGLDSMNAMKKRKRETKHDLPTSEVAWLLGYQETSAFYHAFKRWTGKTPKQTRSILTRASCRLRR